MRRKVLVVDDEPSILRSTELVLDGAGWQVVTTDRADGVLDLALRERPDVLLQDVRMPGLVVDGLVRALRREPALRDVRIVLYTAALEGEAISARLRLPLLEKPCGAEDFERVLADARLDAAAARASLHADA